MEEEAIFDFETEIMDQYAAQNDEDFLFDDYAQGAVEFESYDP